MLYEGGMTMKEKKIPWILKFLLRAILGVGIMLFVNQVLAEEHVAAEVAINMYTIAVAGTLGAPGICAMYGILLYQIM